MSHSVFPEEFMSLQRLHGVSCIFDFNAGDLKCKCVELITRHIIFVTANFQLPDFYHIRILSKGPDPSWEYPEPVPKILLMYTLKKIIKDIVPPLKHWLLRMFYFD